MEQYLAQGIAERTVSNFIHFCLKEGMITKILGKHYEDATDIALIRHEIENIAMSHERKSEYYKVMQEGNGVLSQDATDKTPDLECVQLRIDAINEVLWESLGYAITLITETPGEAIALYEALQRVRTVDAD